MSASRVVNMGCRLNTFESEVMRNLAGKAGLEDTIIFNTCAVTTEAERRVRQLIRREKRHNPEKFIVVAGCAAQLNPKSLSSMPEVDRVVGNDEKLHLDIWKELKTAKKIQVSDIMRNRQIPSHSISGFDNRARAFLQVQQGCDHRCTFCIIPFARGKNRSLSIDTLVKQANRLTNNGYKEIVVTGVDLCSYGADLPDKLRLGAMLRILLDAVPQIQRLRLSSLDPANIDDGVFDLLANEPRLMPNIHLSAQALDNIVLKRMKRRHLAEDLNIVAQRIRYARPGVALGADLIAGFPTESEKMFENTVNAIMDIDIPFLHVFPYSKRPGTPATKMPQISKKIIRERAAKLRLIGERLKRNFFKGQLGTITSVLVENNCVGRTEHSLLVELSPKVLPGDVVDVLITGINSDKLIGNVMDARKKN